MIRRKLKHIFLASYWVKYSSVSLCVRFIQFDYICSMKFPLHVSFFFESIISFYRKPRFYQLHVVLNKKYANLLSTST